MAQKQMGLLLSQIFFRLRKSRVLRSNQFWICGGESKRVARAPASLSSPRHGLRGGRFPVPVVRSAAHGWVLGGLGGVSAVLPGQVQLRVQSDFEPSELDAGGISCPRHEVDPLPA